MRSLQQEWWSCFAIDSLWRFCNYNVRKLVPTVDSRVVSFPWVGNIMLDSHQCMVIQEGSLWLSYNLKYFKIKSQLYEIHKNDCFYWKWQRGGSLSFHDRCFIRLDIERNWNMQWKFFKNFKKYRSLCEVRLFSIFICVS